MDVKLEYYVDSVIDYFITQDAVTLNAYNKGDLSQNEFLEKARDYIATLKVGAKVQENILKRYSDYLWNYDVLEPLIQDKEVTDIHCNAWNNIRIKRIIGNSSTRQEAHVKFESKKHFRRFVEHLAIRNKINLSEQNALQNFVDKKSNDKYRLRCNITTSFLTCEEEPFLYIRKEAKQKKFLSKIMEEGMFSEQLLPAVKEAVKGGIIVSGASGSGKSVFINAILEEIPLEKNVLVMQAEDELFGVKHPDVVAVHTICQKGKGIEYGFQDLAQNAMLLDRDYLIFSEVKGNEARHAFTAALAGHKPWLSLHAPDTRASLEQFGNYIKINADFALEDIYRMLSYTPFTLIHLQNYKINGFTKVCGWDEKKKEIIFEDLL